MSQGQLQKILDTLANIDIAAEPVTTNEKARDAVCEEIAQEYAAFLVELDAPVQTATKQTTNLATGSTMNTTTKTNTPASSAATNAQTLQNQIKQQQELEKNLGQLKTATGGTFDVKKTAQALAANVTPNNTGTVTQATKDLAPAMGKILSDPSLAGQFKTLISKLK